MLAYAVCAYELNSMDGVRMRVCVYESIQGLAKKKRPSAIKKEIKN